MMTPFAPSRSALRAKRFQEALDLARAARRTSPKEVRILVLEGMALSGLAQGQRGARGVQSRASRSLPTMFRRLRRPRRSNTGRGVHEAAAHLQRLLALRPRGADRARHAGGAGMETVRLHAAQCSTSAQAKTAIAGQPDALHESGACLAEFETAGRGSSLSFRQLIAVAAQGPGAHAYSLWPSR